MEPVSAGGVLRRVLSGQRRYVAAGTSLLMAHQVFEALVPVLVGQVIDRAVSTGDGAALGRWIAGLMVLFGVLSLAYRFGSQCLERAEQAAIQDLVLAVTRRVLHPRGGVESSAGALVSVATADATLATAVIGSVTVAAGGLAAILVATISLLIISVPLGLLVLLGLPPVLAAVQLLIRPLQRRLRAQQAQAAVAAEVAGDLVSGLRVLKGLGAEAAAADRYRAASRRSLAAALHAARPESAHRGLSVVVTGATLAVVALIGGRFAAEGRISVGDLVAAVGLVAFLIGPLLRLGLAGTVLAAAWASGQRVAEALSAPPAVGPGRSPLPADGHGELRIVALTTGRLRALSLTVAPGELVAVVPVDPAAATDLLDVLSRTTDAYDGAVDLDGVELRDADLDAVRARLVVSGHHSYLFEGTLADNVLARAEADMLVPALAAAGADELAGALPGGHDAEISERGRSLSGGQRQRVALARALATQAAVLVLHDPTTAIDTATEARIAGGIRDLRRGRSTLLIASSPALLAVADRVLLVEDGRATATGTHAELMSTEPAYRRSVTG